MRALLAVSGLEPRFVDVAAATGGRRFGSAPAKAGRAMTLPDPAIAIEDLVRLNRIRIFFGHADGNMGGIVAGTLLIAIVLHLGGVALSALAGWAGLIAAGSIAIVAFERHVQRTGVTLGNCQRLVQTRIAMGGVVALLWGISAYLLPDPGAHVQDTYLFIILSTLVTVGALSYAVMPVYYITLDVVCLMPLSGKFAYQFLVYDDVYYLLLLVVSLVWQAVVLKKARQVSQTAIEAIVLNERLKNEIDEHMRTREAIRQMAQRDALTGLANRTLFSDRLQQVLAGALRTGARFALLYMDLDRFKPVNDHFGHNVGDLLLKEVAHRIRGSVRESDTAARMGGDEFVVLLRDIDTDDSALAVAEKVREAMAEAFTIEGHQISISCSVGIAIFPDHGRDEIELSSSADAAMYGAKRDGRNTVRLSESVRFAPPAPMPAGN
jgi:diguanylate cyclase (GGDEF)-like protein